MTEPQYAYAFDPTGVMPENKIQGELHTLTPATKEGDYNFIVPKAAPFFSKAVRIIHVASGNRMIHGVDYYFSHKFNAAAEVTPEDVHGSITFIDRELAGQVSIDYRTMGGPFTLDEQGLMEVLAARMYDPRSLVWGVDVIVPTEFPAAPHLTDGEDLVGMDAVVEGMHQIEKAIRGDADLSHNHTKEQVVGLNAALDDRVPQDGPRKYSMSYPINIVDNTAPINLHMPDFHDATDVNVKVEIINEEGKATLVFHGRAPGQSDQRAGMTTWPLHATVEKGYLSDRPMTFEARFDANNVPYITMSVGRLVNSMMVITEVTLNSTYSRAYSKNWALVLVGGNDFVFDKRFTVAKSGSLIIDDVQEGELIPGSIWLIDSTSVRSRTLPIKPPHNTINKFKDNRNLCSKNPASIVGRFSVNDNLVTSLTLDKSNGWFTAQYSSVTDSWTVIDGG